AFVDEFNAMAQIIVDWFNEVGLPVYTGLSGALLDWIAQGVYGISRPALVSGLTLNVGALNTWTPNTIVVNGLEKIGPQTYYVTTDDIFKRIITWHFYKGDGKHFNVSWLKRRIMRFLFGVDGTDTNNPDHRQVSVSFGVDGQVNITILNGLRT